jgi:hypothetical protein
MHQKSILLLSTLLCIVICKNFDGQLQKVDFFLRSSPLPTAFDWRFYNGGKVPAMKSI